MKRRRSWVVCRERCADRGRSACAGSRRVAMIYPEHRDITVLGVQTLDRRAQGSCSTGSGATPGSANEQRLCEQAADSAPGRRARLPRLGGVRGNRRRSFVLEQEHARHRARRRTGSCRSPTSRRSSRSISRGSPSPPPPEAKPGGKNIVSISSAWSTTSAARAARLNALRTADTRLQRADPQYATRAGSNNAHFLLPRPRPTRRRWSTRELALRPGSEVNAIGVYAWFHLSALQKATRLANEPLAPAERAGAGARDARRRRVRASLPRGQLRRRSRRRRLGRRLAAKGHARLLQRIRARGLHVDRRQPLDGPDGRRAHAARGHSSARRWRSAASLEQVVDHASGRGRAALRAAHADGAEPSPMRSTSARRTVRAARRRGCGRPPEAYAQAARSARPDAGAGARARARLDAALPRRGRPVRRLRRRDRPARRRWRVRPGDHRPAACSAAPISRCAPASASTGVLGEGGDGLVFVSLGVRGDTRVDQRRSGVLAGARCRRRRGGDPVALRLLDSPAHAVLSRSRRPAVLVADVLHLARTPTPTWR